MDYKELDKFLEVNKQDGKAEAYFNMVCEQLSAANKKADKYTLYIAFVILGYFFIGDLQLLEGINIGPFALKNFSTLKTIIPALYAYLIFQYMLTGRVSSELTLTAKFCFAKIYKHSISVDELEYHVNTNSITKRILPFSFWSELNAIKLGGWGLFLYIVSWLATISFVYYFQYITFKYLYINFFHDGMTKVFLVITAWLILINMYFFYEAGKQTWDAFWRGVEREKTNPSS